MSAVARRMALVTPVLVIAGAIGIHDEARAAPSRSEAQPLLRLPPPEDVPSYEPVPAGEEPAPVPLDLRPRFLGGPELDDEILARICHQPLRSLSPLGGGASISLKAVFQDGSRAAVKPDQAHVTRYQAEVAAYRVARALGIDRVAPSCVRRFPKEVLIHPGLPRGLRERMEAEVRVGADGQVACAVIHWVPNLRSLGLDKQSWWQPLLQRGGPWPREPERRRRLLDIATLLLFDFIILNDDRWSGGNTHASGERMVYLDQGAGFGRDSPTRRAYVFARLRQAQRFDHEVVQALWALDLTALRRELQPLLTEREITELGERVAQAQRYLQRLAGEAAHETLLRP